jgi:uncharacterized protein (DUF2141 family)
MGCFIFGSVLFWSCAKEGFPPGGPEDKTPPVVLTTFPRADSVNVGCPSEISIAFAKPMNRKTVEEAIFISPRLEKDVAFRWRNNTLFINLAEKLKTPQTYTVTVGAKAVDQHGNHLPFSHTFAFSTGPKVDRGSIGGTLGLFDGTATAGLVWAFILAPGDSFDPAARPPDYVTQANTDGKYMFDHLAKGRYRVLAIIDKNNDGELSYGVDQVGIPPFDAVLTDSLPWPKDCNFLMADYDTAAPTPVNATASDQCHLTVSFEGALDRESVRQPAAFFIRDTLSHDTLAVKMAYPADAIGKKVVLVTAPQKPKKNYQLIINPIKSSIGRPMAKPAILEFTGSNLPDTVRPAIKTITPKDITAPVPADELINITFNKALDTTHLPQVELRDSTGNPTVITDSWPEPWRLLIKPAALLKGSTKYTVRCSLASCRDWNGLPGRDTVFSSSFRTANPDTLGNLSGSIVDQAIDRPGRLILTLTMLDKKDIIKEIILDHGGVFSFPHILPGRYRLSAYKDVDGNHTYNYGRIRPFLRPEPYAVFPDPINVRSQWDVEEVNVLLK